MEPPRKLLATEFTSDMSGIIGFPCFPAESVVAWLRMETCGDEGCEHPECKALRLRADILEGGK